MKRFFAVSNEMMATKLVTKNAVTVYAVINSFTENSDGKCFKGSNGYLSMVTGLSTKTVKVIVKTLLDKEWILSNGFHDERRRLQAIPVEEITELQLEYSETKKRLKKLSEESKDKITPLEKWLEEKRKNRASSEPVLHLEGETGTLEAPVCDHNDTSNDTSNEISNDTSNDDLEASFISSIEELNEESLPTTEGGIRTTDVVSDDLQLFKEMLYRCERNEHSLDNMFARFTQQTNRKVVFYGRIDNIRPVGFYINAKHPTVRTTFERNRYLVFHGTELKEIVSQYL